MSLHDESVTVARGMTAYGGSFVKALGEVIYCADPINTLKIKETWPDLWQRYFDMGEDLE